MGRSHRQYSAPRKRFVRVTALVYLAIPGTTRPAGACPNFSRRYRCLGSLINDLGNAELARAG